MSAENILNQFGHDENIEFYRKYYNTEPWSSLTDEERELLVLLSATEFTGMSMKFAGGERNLGVVWEIEDRVRENPIFKSAREKEKQIERQIAETKKQKGE